MANILHDMLPDLVFHYVKFIHPIQNAKTNQPENSTVESGTYSQVLDKALVAIVQRRLLPVKNQKMHQIRHTSSQIISTFPIHCDEVPFPQNYKYPRFYPYSEIQKRIPIIE